jgi:hypothetical protein
MQRIPFALAALVVAALIVSLCGMNRGDSEKEQRASNWAEIKLNRSLQGPWESGTAFVMQWNDACKKLLFDGYPICHEEQAVYDTWHGSCCGTIRGFSFRGAPLTSSMLAPEHPDEYSFDVQNIGNYVATCDSTEHDSRVHYGMEWNDLKNAFVFRKIEPICAPTLPSILITIDCFDR